MHDQVVVRMGDRGADFAEQIEKGARRGTPGGDIAIDRHAVHVFHYQKRRAVSG